MVIAQQSLRQRLFWGIAIAALFASATCVPTDDRNGRAAAAAQQYVHGNFLLTTEQLASLITDLPAAVQQRIMETPQYFVELLFESMNALPPEHLVLIDKMHRLMPDYVPPDLVALDQYVGVLTLTKPNMLASERIIPDLLAMSTEAARYDILIPISSAYRSYDYQDFLYSHNAELYGAEAISDTIAVAGHSQHQLGTTIDFGTISDGFGETPEGQWLLENGWRFGFSLSYPPGAEQQTGYRYESWHYRHIGRAAARLEHYFFNSQQQVLLEYIARRHAEIVTLLQPINYAYR